MNTNKGFKNYKALVNELIHVVEHDDSNSYDLSTAMEILAITYRELGEKFPRGYVRNVRETTIGWNINNKFVYLFGVRKEGKLWIHVKDWNVEMPPEDTGVDYYTEDKTVLAKYVLSILKVINF